MSAGLKANSMPTPTTSSGVIATVNGETITNLPPDLYIPPAAMQVWLKSFTGPLDLLLYLIRKQNIDILNIPVALVTRQYIEYINLMQDLKIELVAEYLVMAAILTEIKSRMLLPIKITEATTDQDPRLELVRRLQEYERYQLAAQELNHLIRIERDIFVAHIADQKINQIKPEPTVSIDNLTTALAELMQRAVLYTTHHIQLEAISLADKQTYLLGLLNHDTKLNLTQAFTLREGRLGIVVTFLAMLELIRQGLIEYIQAEEFAPIYLHLKQKDQILCIAP